MSQMRADWEGKSVSFIQTHEAWANGYAGQLAGRLGKPTPRRLIHALLRSHLRVSAKSADGPLLAHGLRRRVSRQPRETHLASKKAVLPAIAALLTGPWRRDSLLCARRRYSPEFRYGRRPIPLPSDGDYGDAVPVVAAAASNTIRRMDATGLCSRTSRLGAVRHCPREARRCLNHF